MVPVSTGVACLSLQEMPPYSGSSLKTFWTPSLPHPHLQPLIMLLNVTLLQGTLTNLRPLLRPQFLHVDIEMQAWLQGCGSCLALVAR